MVNEPVKLTEKEIKSVESVLSKGYRVELMLVKNGIKIIQICRNEVKSNK